MWSHETDKEMEPIVETIGKKMVCSPCVSF